ncbi:MAG: urease accessory protein UreF [Betaproteobacteria bacterium]|nr:urease accessory protein UreF [Betaproteobacteria bacterium]
MPLADSALLRLLQLVSPSLPVGAYSYSQGLEGALASGLPPERGAIAGWIGDHLEFCVARCEAPVLARLHRAWRAGDIEAVGRWNEFFVASRDSAEFRAETLQMGFSLARLLEQLGSVEPRRIAALKSLPPAFPAAFALAACDWGVPQQAALVGYLWAWAENQVLAALKAAPLGQTAGQAMLQELAAGLPGLAAAALTMDDDDIAGFAPGLAIASCLHETQGSRIFRS